MMRGCNKWRMECNWKKQEWKWHMRRHSEWRGSSIISEWNWNIQFDFLLFLRWKSRFFVAACCRLRPAARARQIESGFLFPRHLALATKKDPAKRYPSRYGMYLAEGFFLGCGMRIVEMLFVLVPSWIILRWNAKKTTTTDTIVIFMHSFRLQVTVTKLRLFCLDKNTPKC